MTALELDPVFVKALKLLHSKNKDSTAQLKNMLDDAIAQRREQKCGGSLSEGEKSSQLVKVAPGKSEEEAAKKRDAEKRNFEKLKQDLVELSQEPKKSKKDFPVLYERDIKPSKDKDSKDREKEREKEKSKKDKETREKERKQQERKEKEKALADKVEKEKERDKLKEKEKNKEKTEDSSDEDASMDADDFAFGLGISCVVCRQFDVSSGNQLVECQECHNLYHQECHRPPVMERDVNDPRFVWYCSRCSKTFKKMVSKPAKQKTSVSFVPPPSKDSSPPFLKVTKSEHNPSLQPFRRLDTKTSSAKEASSITGTKPLSGLASLAANLSGKTVDTSKQGTSKSEPIKSFAALKTDQSKFSSQSKSDQSEKISAAPSSSKCSGKPGNSGKQSSGGSSVAATADKRLQMMKKKAAAKLQEKRVHVK